MIFLLPLLWQFAVRQNPARPARAIDEQCGNWGCTYLLVRPGKVIDYTPIPDGQYARRAGGTILVMAGHSLARAPVKAAKPSGTVEYPYGPHAGKLAMMSGQSIATAYIPPPTGPVCVNVGEINDLLADTPLAGEGQHFYDAGSKYHVNPALVVAIAGADSLFGRAANNHRGLHNAWDWGNSPPTRSIARGWTNWREGIDRVTYQLSDHLYMGNAKSPATTTSAIYGQWCHSGDCAGGLRTVNQILGRLGVSPASLRFKPCSGGGQ